MKKTIFLLMLVVASLLFWRHVETERVRSQEDPLTLYGNVDIRELTLGFRISGRLEEMYLEEGDRVQAGAVVARLDDKPYQDDLAVKKAQRREAQAALANAEKKFLRLDALLKNKSVSQSDYDDSLALRDELAAKLETAEALVESSSTSLTDASLKSPSDGTVVIRAAEPGAIVAAGQTVYVISLDNPVWVRAYVDEPNLGLLSPGQKVAVRTDSGRQFSGQIGFISPKAEFTPKSVETQALRTSLVYRLRIVVDAPAQSLRQGMPVTVTIDKL
ncbi:MAG: efflux RND transporter periplasmic adaptor subunit [Deltaproteobacteria bacterium]|jgi:HlyD family secretion protein|nr:efflux RND transporter periplasmic adaptor subunit [Deltaproteobacteria bacterium]